MYRMRYERRRKRAVAEFDEAAEPLLEELRASGFQARDGRYLVDLANEELPDPALVPILLRWLPRIEHDRVKASIGRALADPVAKPMAAPVAMEELRKLLGGEESPGQAALALCIKETATLEALEDVMDLVRQRQLGVEVRSILAETLARLRDPRAVEVAIELTEDPVLRPVAVYVLGELKDDRARLPLRQLLDDPEVGEAARIALAKLERARPGA